MPRRLRKTAGHAAVSGPSTPAVVPMRQRKRKVLLVMKRMNAVLCKELVPRATGATQQVAVVMGSAAPAPSSEIRRRWKRGVVTKPALIPVVQGSALAVSDPVLAARLSGVIVNYLVNPDKYDSAFRKYAEFCDTRGLRHFPATEQVLCGFVLDSSTTVSQSSIKSYLAAVKYSQVNAGVHWEVPEKAEHLRRVLRYCKRRYGVAGKACKIPISCEVLMQMCGHIPHFPNFSLMSHNDRTFVTASTIAVCGFLRGGEFLTYKGSKRPVLKQADVVVQGTGDSAAVVVHIERPKNLWWVPKVAVRCAGFKAESMLPMNPGMMLLQYRALALKAGVRLSDGGAAFVLAPDVVLSRDWMVKRSADLLTKAGIEFLGEDGKASRVKAASWRAGAVRSALNANIPGTTIMELGRWRSYAWLSYSSFTETERDMAMASIWQSRGVPSAPIDRVGITRPEAVFATLDREAEAMSETPLFRN